MTDKEFDVILDNLDRAYRYKRDIALAVAKAEMKAIEDKYLAYYDGAYDAIKAVRTAMLKSVGEQIGNLTDLIKNTEGRNDQI